MRSDNMCRRPLYRRQRPDVAAPTVPTTRFKTMSVRLARRSEGSEGRNLPVVHPVVVPVVPQPVWPGSTNINIMKRTNIPMNIHMVRCCFFLAEALPFSQSSEQNTLSTGIDLPQAGQCLCSGDLSDTTCVLLSLPGAGRGPAVCAVWKNLP